jgi:hypothetical protein
VAVDIPSDQKALKIAVSTRGKNISILVKERDELWASNKSYKFTELMKNKAEELSRKIISGMCKPHKYSQLDLSTKDVRLGIEAFAWSKRMIEVQAEIEYIHKEIQILQKLCDNEHPNRRNFDDYFKCFDCGLVIDNTPPKHF